MSETNGTYYLTCENAVFSPATWGFRCSTFITLLCHFSVSDGTETGRAFEGWHQGTAHLTIDSGHSRGSNVVVDRMHSISLAYGRSGQAHDHLNAFAWIKGLGASPCTAAPEGLPPSPVQHRLEFRSPTSILLSRSWHTPIDTVSFGRTEEDRLWATGRGTSAHLD